MKIIAFALISFVAFLASFLWFGRKQAPAAPVRQWSLQSIDTMKYSRDKAHESMTNPGLEVVIKKQIKAIADTGATHIAVATAYDEEFIPVIEFWVREARANNLKVFFRGNFSGWEQWYGYEKIDRATHIAKTVSFIESNPHLFEDGDIFSSCPECENGEQLDRSNNEQIESYKAFLIEEYNATKQSFSKINRNVASNYFSMNGDIAFRIMDKEMTHALDGIVVIDHYVASTDRLARDIRALAEKSGGKIVLGEFGAPIPDIHGRMTEVQQKEWVEDALRKISVIPELTGVNYWVGTGGSTAIWRENGNPTLTVNVLSDYYKGKFSSK